jgi:hypothetical protein
MPIRVVVIDGTTAEITQAGVLIEGLTAGHLLADQGYDKALYRLRHRVENVCLHLKRWRGMATCYAKNPASCLAAVHIRCMSLWANIWSLHDLKCRKKKINII